MGSFTLDDKNIKKYYFSTADLVTIALFASLGGVFSAFIGNLGRLVAESTGLGAVGGQKVSGLHIFWLTLVFLLIDRKYGGVILCGVLKGFVELFTGSTLGITVVVIAASQAIVFEIVHYLLSSFSNPKYIGSFKVLIAAGFSSVSNIVIQVNTFLGMALPFELYLLIFIVSFLSGVILGGYLGLNFYHLFAQSGILDWKKNDKNTE